MIFRSTILAAALLVGAPGVSLGADPDQRVKSVVDATMGPLMAKDAIPGLAVAIVVAGKSHVFAYGLASKEPRRPVTRDTLFEIGSISKTFTATLAAYAQASGALSLCDPTSQALPSLRGTAFGAVRLLHLATHTPGGLPLQVPDDIRTEDELVRYFKAWTPTYAPGTYRTYSNPGIGTLGLIAAKRMGGDFADLLQRRVFAPLGMTRSSIDVPPERIADYAQGYTQADAPIRLAPGLLAAEAYGIRTTAPDLMRFVEANMDPAGVADATLRRAIEATHVGYFTAGPMTQDLIWEQYSYPVALKALLAGNARRMIVSATPVTPIEPPRQPSKDVWINKTGSTNGFGAYAAFVPAKRLGIVILANKNFPIDDRVAAADAILAALAGETN